MKKLLFVFGTRPEAIKMAPLIIEFKKDPYFEAVVCVTGQHRQMLDQVLDFFDIKPDYDLNLMRSNQDLFDITSSGISALKDVTLEVKPDIILVQGDTTTAFIGALAGYYAKTKVAHIEAGLRSGDKFSPYPEEIFRILAGHISDYHFAPTERAAEKLRAESIVNNVHVVGNTVIDALFLGLDIIRNKGENEYYEYFNYLDFNKKIILVTGHRRENFGGPLRDVCKAIEELAKQNPDVQFVYPVHMNPNVQSVVNQHLSNFSNVFLIEPLDYPKMIWLMSKTYLIVTDSGGVQEEAPSLGKPVLVTREVTERVEGIEAGGALLVGTNPGNIIAEVNKLLQIPEHYAMMSQAKNPYGDGCSSDRVIKTLKVL